MVPHLTRSLELERSSHDLLARHAWLRNAMIWCSGLAHGKPEQQAAYLSACFAERCNAAEQCAQGSKELSGLVLANSRARAELLAQRGNCEKAWTVEALRKDGTSVDAFVNLQIAIASGNDQRARLLSLGGEDDYEMLGAAVAMRRAAESFFRAAETRHGPVSAELARVQQASAQSPMLPLEDLRLVELNKTEYVMSPDGRRVLGGFVHHEGRWKFDLDHMIRSNPPSNVTSLELLRFAYDEGTRYLLSGRSDSPASVVNAVGQCFGLGSMVLLGSMDRAKAVCAELMARKLQ